MAVSLPLQSVPTRNTSDDLEVAEAVNDQCLDTSGLRPPADSSPVTDPQKVPSCEH